MPTSEPDTAPVPEAPNIPTERATALEGASPLKGRDSEGRSRRLKDKPRPRYNCTLGDKHIPIAVRQASRKKVKYCQRMAKHSFEGDAILRAQRFLQAIIFSSHAKPNVPNNLPLIEDIMNFPLSKFIHFS